MDIRFDANAAKQLLMQMDAYCTGIQREAKGLLAVLNGSDHWNDNQKKAFQANIMELAIDLNRTLTLEGDYMRTLYQRVQELRG